MLYIYAMIALAGGFLLGYLIRSLRAVSAESALRAELARCEARIRQADDERRLLDERTEALHRAEKLCAELRAGLDARDRMDASDEARGRVMEAEFRRIASAVLEGNSRRIADAGREELDKVVAPLRERLAEFGNLVSKTYTDTAKEQYSLKEQIARLIVSSRQIGDDARKLADALTGNTRIQGDWGEHILETMLENRRGRAYAVG